MKVLVVNDWTKSGGGIERYLELVVGQLRLRGDEVRLLAGAVGDGAAAEYPVRTSNRMAAQAVLQVVNPWAVRQARRAVREFAPDVALVSMFEMRLSPAVLRALGSTPFVLCAGYYKPICPTGLRLLPSGALCTHRAGRVCVDEGCVGTAHWARDQVRYALIRSEIRRAATVVACSEYLRDELVAAGIDAEWFPYPARPVLKPLARVRSAAPSFLFAGRFAPEKGLETLFDAFARARPSLPGARLRLVGDGPLLPHVPSLAERYGIGDSVGVVGWSSQEQLDGLMAEAWAVVVPSVWAEPFGLVALDAIVRGIPVVASNAGGLREIVDHGVSGLLVPRGDAEALAEALVAVGTGNAFASGSVPMDAVSRLAAAHDSDRHVEWLQDRLEGVACATP
jgi:glycosyltransferase involved in cell wall biosynthesis